MLSRHLKYPLVFRLVIPVITLLAAAIGPVPLAAAHDGEPPPHFEPSECPFTPPFGVTIKCGYLSVPENRSIPDSPTIRLAVAIIKSRSEHPAPDPVIYLEGGPGVSALDGVSYWAMMPFLENRDFILVDQRGTGYSEPGLHCPEYDDLISDTLDDLLDNEEAIRLTKEASLACRDRLLEKGIDLSAYNSAESAADLADLRIALGYKEWNLYGISYGTRLAQTIMRDHPEGIRSVILDSTVPIAANTYEAWPETTPEVFTTFFNGCAADPACSRAFPDLEAHFYELVDQADEEPLVLRMTNPYTEEPVDVPFTGDALINTIFGALYDSGLIPYVPLIIERAYQGDTRLLERYAELDLMLDAETDFSIGMYYSVECYEEVPFNEYGIAQQASERHPELNKLIVNESDFLICPEWGVEQASPLENEPVTSPIPTLVLAGEYDPITPVTWGQMTAETLPNSYFFSFPGLGHGTTLMDCPQSIAMHFIASPMRRPNASCLRYMEGPEFVTGITTAPGIYDMLQAYLLDADGWQYLLLVTSLLIFGSAAILWPMLRIAHYIRQKPNKPPRRLKAAAWLAALLGAWNLLFLLGLAVITMMVIIHDEVLLFFGLPRWAFPLLLMPVISALLTAALLGLNLVVWRETYWKLPGKLFYSVIALGAVLFTGWLINWQFIRLPF